MEKSGYILLVEDEIIPAMQMTVELQRAGFRVLDFVCTGEEAVACALKEKPDLILMDINLAGKIDGIEAATIIRKISSSVKIIMVTDYNEELLKQKAFNTGVNDYLLKEELTKLKNYL